MKDWFVPKYLGIPFIDDVMRWLNSGKPEAIAVYVILFVIVLLTIFLKKRDVD